MRTARRLLKDEAGMTMGLAVIMIVLLGVMGAGLLTFVSKDLNVVIEENRGQRAFEVADAGIGAAKRQLASGVDTTKYDDPVVNPLAPVNDIQWSAAAGGLTLDDLDEDATTMDSVNVKIKYRSDTEDFLVVSEGDYGSAKRKIEAIFKGEEVPAGEGENIGHPLYYTPSDIRIEAKTDLAGISLFSERDILIEGITNPTTGTLDFVRDYEGSNKAVTDTIASPAKGDALCDWNSATPSDPQHCFVDSTGNWNTTPRKIIAKNKQTGQETLVNFDTPGFAAEGKICGFTPGIAKGTCSTSPSIADGVYGYDSTTGAKVINRTADGYTTPWGNNLKFVAKEDLTPPLDPNEDANPSGTITYPFPRPTPKAKGFKEQACLPLTLAACTPVLSNDYFVGNPSESQWATLLSSSEPDRIAFVDGNGGDVVFDAPGGTQYKGILVVWCGHLRQVQSFKGIILSLYGDGSSFGSSNCTGNDDLGTYINTGTVCQCWVYAQGGSATRAGITFGPSSTIRFLPSGAFSFDEDLFDNPAPPTTFKLQGWRELYE